MKWRSAKRKFQRIMMVEAEAHGRQTHSGRASDSKWAYYVGSGGFWAGPVDFLTGKQPTAEADMSEVEKEEKQQQANVKQ